MGIRYVGGKPARVMGNATRKNTDRWMHEPEHKHEPINGEIIILNIIGLVVCVFLIWFVSMCFR